MSNEGNQQPSLAGAASQVRTAQLERSAPFPVTEIQNVQASGRLLARVPSSPHAPLTMEELKLRNFDQLKERASELGSGEFLVEGLIPKRQIVLLVGDSGLGKSALLYQASVSVSAGIPFLGHETQQGLVFYFDFENGLNQTVQMVERQAKYLGLLNVPPAITFWHYGDCADNYEKQGHGLLDIILAYKPTLAIIDSLSAYYPAAEEKNPLAAQLFRDLRKVIRGTGTTIICVHHLKKPSTRSGEAPEPLESARARDWFQQARGASALITGSDVRLGVDLPRRNILPAGNPAEQGSEEVALVLKGFARVQGEIGPLYLARVFDEEGEPLAYRELAGPELLFNPNQQAAFAHLSESFTFGEAKRTYGKQDQATSDFLKKLQQIGLIHKTGRGQYRKTSPAPERAERARNLLSGQGLDEPVSPECERSSAE